MFTTNNLRKYLQTTDELQVRHIISTTLEYIIINKILISSQIYIK